MTEPRPDTNPEHYATGADTGGGPWAAVPVNTPASFRLDPAPYPLGAVVAMNLLVAAAAVGLHFFLRHEADGPRGRRLAYAVPAAAVLIAGGGFAALASWESSEERRRGTWLVYERESRQVLLPRHGEAFDLADVVHLQDLVATKPDDGPLAEPWAELSLVTCRNGDRRRWHLMKYDPGGRGPAFDALLKPLAEATPIPVVRVRRSRSGGVTVEPFPR